MLVPLFPRKVSSGSAGPIPFLRPKMAWRLPIPTHFFKVVITRVNGKRVAVGFLVPYRVNLGDEVKLDTISQSWCRFVFPGIPQWAERW